uniref:eRF1 domain-containing protein n=1 Tax=Cannabis sativa TaxID=3483 RepID=A0A803P9E6_CANSA
MGDFNEERVSNNYFAEQIEDKWIVAAEKLEIFKDPIELVREDLVGKQFLTFEDAEFFIHQYSNMIGFSLRKGKVKRQFGGAIKYRQWVCSKEGHRELKWIKNLNRKRELRAITRNRNRYIFEMVCTAASRLSEDVKKVVQIRVKSKGPYEASFVLVVLSFSQLTVLVGFLIKIKFLLLKKKCNQTDKYIEIWRMKKSVLYRATVELPKKHGRGGQSALRFSRHIMESRHNYVTKTGEKAAELFIDQKTNMPNVAGLVLAALQI